MTVSEIHAEVAAGRLDPDTAAEMLLTMRDDWYERGVARLVIATWVLIAAGLAVWWLLG